MSKTQSPLVIRVAEPEAAAAWMVDNLFFQPTQEPDTVVNGTCRMTFAAGGAAQCRPAPPGLYHTGPEHMALRTADIQAALAHCKQRKLPLNLNNGQVWFNPGVYGEGEYYFNFVTPFGLLVEISQRAAQPHYGESQIIQGLDHVGIPSEDITRRMACLSRQGFSQEFAPIQNYNDTEGRIFCCMMRRDDLILEVYQFADMVPSGCAASGCLTLPGLEL